MQWIKIPLSIQEEEWFKDSITVHLFFHLLAKSFNTDGTVAIPLRRLAEELNTTVDKIRTRLAKLESCGTIRIPQKSHKNPTKIPQKTTSITICNFDSYAHHKNYESHKNPTKIPQKSHEQKENLPPTPPLKENNIYSSSSSISACEEKNFIEILKGDRQWGETVAMRYSLGTLEALDSWLDQFAIDIECRGVIHKDLQDAKRHFNDWLRIQQNGKRNYPSRDKADIIRERQEQHMRDIERINADYLAKVGQQPD